jgi:formylglycine-generating enzyme required for sulfatase activity
MRLLVAAMLVAVTVRPAASDSCPEVERDERGKCPPRTAPGRKPPLPVRQPQNKPEPDKTAGKPEPDSAAGKTELDIQGAEIAGARVSLDGRSAGFAPLILEATPGRRLLELHKVGYAPYSTWVDARRGERVAVPVRLQPAGGAPPPIEAKQGSCPSGMMEVPAGKLQMAARHERPREVTLAGYCIDKVEVTVKAYAACVAARACAAAPRTVKWDGQPAERVKRYSWFCNGDDRPDHPINCVDGHQAEAYCAWAGKRLPTNEEWQYAALGNDGRTYPWGTDPPSVRRLNACGGECAAMALRVLNTAWPVMYNASDRWEATAPVGSFSDGASPFGALDMEGNVKEWTGSLTGVSSGKQGADANRPRIVRGSGWTATNPTDFGELARWGQGSTERSHDVGFRCARGSRAP